jgi:hypothetical protein
LNAAQRNSLFSHLLVIVTPAKINSSSQHSQSQLTIGQSLSLYSPHRNHKEEGLLKLKKSK